MASRRMYRMFPSWLFRAVRSRGNLAASTRRNLANSFGVVGTLIQPRGNVSVTPWPETRSAPDGACDDDETGVLSFRPAHRLCPAWNAPHPRASPNTAAATRTSGCLIAREARRPGSWAPGWPVGGLPNWGVAPGSGFMSVMVVYFLASRAAGKFDELRIAMPPPRGKRFRLLYVGRAACGACRCAPNKHAILRP